MRIRTVKPGFWHDEELASVSAEAQLLAIGLLNMADDEGYFRFIPKLIESTIFPLRELSVSIHGMLTELSNIGFIECKKGSDGKQYGHVVNFQKNQRVNRPTASEIAPFLKDCESSLNPHGILTESSLPEGKGKERKVKDNTERENKAPKREIPTIEDCEQAAIACAPSQHADFAASVGREFYGIYAAMQPAWVTRGGDDLCKNQTWKHKLRSKLENEIRAEIGKDTRYQKSAARPNPQQPNGRSRANGSAAGAGINVPML